MLLRIALGGIIVTVELNESRTARKIADGLPIKSWAQLWGDEVYFEIPLATGEENPQANVPSGTVAYWPPGRALCLFFGQQPYSPVNVVGRMRGDPRVLSAVTEGAPVRAEADNSEV